MPRFTPLTSVKTRIARKKFSVKVSDPYYVIKNAGYTFFDLVKCDKDCLYEEISHAQIVLSSNLKGNSTTQPNRRWKYTTKI
jgi:hypothetical protein